MALSIPQYDEVKVRIVPGASGGYRVTAFGPDGSTASGELTLPVNELELENFVLRVGRPRRDTRAFRSPEMETARGFGGQLFEALINGGVRDVYLAARKAADSQDRGLRLTLALTEVPELLRIPWEFLYQRPSFLSQSIYTTVVRSLDLTNARPPRAIKLPLRILGLVSVPQGVQMLDVEREKASLTSALESLIEAGVLELEWLERATFRCLNEALSTGREVHVLHYIGHGAYDARAGGILVLEKEDRSPHEVTGQDLGSLLQDERTLRLVVLNACEGARASDVDPFSGVATSLVEQNIPAVIGMQFEITDEAAVTFAGSFYNAIARGYPVDAALAQARKAIFAAERDIEFGTPVLFLRGSDARLFDIDSGTDTSQPAPQDKRTDNGDEPATAQPEPLHKPMDGADEPATAQSEPQDERTDHRDEPATAQDEVPPTRHTNLSSSVYLLVATEPGMTVAQIAGRLGVAHYTVHTTLAGLLQERQIEKRGGGWYTGHRGEMAHADEEPDPPSTPTSDSDESQQRSGRAGDQASEIARLWDGVRQSARFGSFVSSDGDKNVAALTDALKPSESVINLLWGRRGAAASLGLIALTDQRLLAFWVGVSGKPKSTAWERRAISNAPVVDKGTIKFVIPGKSVTLTDLKPRERVIEFARQLQGS